MHFLILFRMGTRFVVGAAQIGSAEGESDVLAKIAKMSEPDCAMARRLHAIIKASTPALSPRLWYGMPAYARDGKVVCFFQSAQKFNRQMEDHRRSPRRMQVQEARQQSAAKDNGAAGQPRSLPRRVQSHRNATSGDHFSPLPVVSTRRSLVCKSSVAICVTPRSRRTATMLFTSASVAS